MSGITAWSGETLELNFTDATYLLKCLTMKWYDPKRDDCPEDRLQDRIHITSLCAAHAEWPEEREALYREFRSDEECEKWYAMRLAQTLGNGWDVKYFESDFRDDLIRAREFLAACVAAGTDARFSR